MIIRNSPLWKSAPKQQLAYLAVKYWARLYCPEVILGVYSTDELEPTKRTIKDITPTDANLLVNGNPEENQQVKQGKSIEDRLSDYISKVEVTTSLTKLEQMIIAARNIFNDYPEYLAEAEKIYFDRLKALEEPQQNL